MLSAKLKFCVLVGATVFFSGSCSDAHAQRDILLAEVDARLSEIKRESFEFRKRKQGHIYSCRDIESPDETLVCIKIYRNKKLDLMGEDVRLQEREEDLLSQKITWLGTSDPKYNYTALELKATKLHLEYSKLAFQHEKLNLQKSECITASYTSNNPTAIKDCLTILTLAESKKMTDREAELLEEILPLHKKLLLLAQEDAFRYLQELLK